MTLAPGPFGPQPAPKLDSLAADWSEDAALSIDCTAVANALATAEQTASSVAEGPSDDAAIGADDDAVDVPAPSIYTPAPLSFARPIFAPTPRPLTQIDEADVEPLRGHAMSASSMDGGAAMNEATHGDASEYLHPAEHLPEPEPADDDWHRIDRTPRTAVSDYARFRYVKPSPSQPAPQVVEAAGDSLENEEGARTDALEAAQPAESMNAWPFGEPAHTSATQHTLEPSAENGGTKPAATNRDFLVLASMLGMGLANVDAAGAVWPLNEAGASLLEALGSTSGGVAPSSIIEALSFARAGSRPFLRDTPALSPEARHISVSAIANHEGGLIAMRDHTEETLLQERLLQSEKMASVGQLVSGVAHELNNPLTGVMGFAQLLLARDLDLTVRGQIQTIYGEAERAAKIVQNLLSFARRRKPTKEMCDVNALLQRVLELRSYDFNIRNISLDMTMDLRMEHVWADPDQIQQVFFNVIKNAEQAMIDAHRGGRLSVSTAGMADGVRVTIADNGPGIPPDVQRRIFDPFFTTKEAGEGTGLGLTICYGIMDEHNGRIWTENLTGGGAAFNIELPVGKEDEPDVYDRGVDDNSLLPAPSVSSRKVLVVDDEESIRLLLHDILRLDDHAVRVARSGLEAFECVREEHFDVIITDMKMPGMDGASFYREVRLRDPALARRIVFITGDTVSPDTRAFLQRVSNPVLSKPFKIGPLRDAIETVLQQP